MGASGAMRLPRLNKRRLSDESRAMTNALVTLLVKLVLILLFPLIIVGGSVALMVGCFALFRVVEKRRGRQ